MWRRPGADKVVPMTITTASRRALPWAATLTFVCFVLSAALGSSGTIEGDPDTGQQIANVTFPIFVIGIPVVALLAITTLIGRRRRP
jgi:hypothetical protein